jgi:hypothetical protein
MQTEWWGHLLWIVGAALLGFFIPAVGAGVLRLARPVLLIPYLAVVGPYLYAYVRWSGMNPAQQLHQHWGWGLLGAAVFGAFMVNNVLSQPSSARSQDWRLAVDLVWLGGVYGVLDALLLSVMPVLAAWQALSRLGWTSTWGGRIGAGAVALVASVVVTVAYHLGYPEYRGPTIAGPITGNAMGSLAQLTTANPLAAVGSHVAMHVTAVLHGPATTMQLPPHY